MTNYNKGRTFPIKIEKYLYSWFDYKYILARLFGKKIKATGFEVYLWRGVNYARRKQ